MKIEVYASNTHVSKKDMDGKVVVAVDTLRAATTIITALHNGCAQIIPVEDVEKAMEPMYTTKPDMDRSGMGFAFMEAFMDELEVISEPGQGTTVLMSKKLGTLPFIDREE